MGQPNWGRLKAQGRVKDVGLPWSEAEAKALAQGVPADFVRRGALSKEDYAKMVAADEKAVSKNGELPLEAMDMGQLQAKANELGITGFTPDVSNEALRGLIQAKLDEGAQAITKKKGAKTK